MSSSLSLFHVYNILTLPLSVNNDSMQSTRAVDLPSVLAINGIKRYFVELSDKQLTSGHSSDTCVIKISHHCFDDPTCSTTLFFDDQKLIHKTCKFVLLNKAVQPLVVELGDSKIVISNISNIVYTCSHGCVVKLKPCKGSCVIDLPCGVDVLYWQMILLCQLALKIVCQEI